MNPIVIQPYPSCRQTGLSLVELMISLTIGLFLLLGITTLIVQQSSTRGEMEKSSRQIENGRYAMQILRDDIQLAGFYGTYGVPTPGANYSAPDPCDITNNTANLGTPPGNLGWVNNSLTSPTVPVAIYGYAGGDTTPASCATNYQPNTAILVVRRTATDTVAAAVAGPTYLQAARCATTTIPFVLGTGAASFTLQNKDCATAAPLYLYIVRLYYVSTCSVCAPSDGIPTLKMVEFVNGVRTVVPLVEGIENMQFDYGVDTNGDGSPDDYTTAPAAAWSNVMTVRVNLLARNNDPTTGYTDPKTYHLGLADPVTPGGAYKRHAYSQLVRVINPSGRREVP